MFRPLFWGALIFSYITAILPQEVAPTVGDLSDKTLHFLAFALLSLLLMLAYRMFWLKGVLYLLVYALFIEVTQSFTSTRCAESLDVVADAIGTALGLLLYFGYKQIGKRL